MNGYETAFTIKEITEDTIDQLALFAKTIPQTIDKYATNLNVILKPAQIKHLLNVFLGLHTSSATDFEFRPADKSTILNVVKVIKEELERSGGVYDGFDQEINQEQIIASTPIGNFFADKKEKPPKKRVQTRKINANSAILTPADKSIDNIEILESTQLEYGKKLLQESFCHQVRAALLTYTKAHAQEIRFMESCGLNSIKDGLFQVILDDSNIKLFVMAQNGLYEQSVSLTASTQCYCSRDSATVISVYFRPGNKFQKVMSSPHNLEQGSNQLSTCWVVGNFVRHLSSHSKLYDDNNTNFVENAEAAENRERAGSCEPGTVGEREDVYETIPNAGVEMARLRLPEPIALSIGMCNKHKT